MLARLLLLVAPLLTPAGAQSLALSAAAPAPPIIVVHLRRPRPGDPTDGREDPFWESGSFGITGCHGRNLLHPANAQDIEGARLAFAQGGREGFRLVYVTPPITTRQLGPRVEALWTPAGMPLRYEEAPLLMSVDGRTDFPFLKRMLRAVRRDAWTSRFSSKFRTRTQPLPEEDGRGLAQLFDNRLAGASAAELASTYVDAMPYPPGQVEGDRRARLSLLRRAAARRRARRR